MVKDEDLLATKCEVAALGVGREGEREWTDLAALADGRGARMEGSSPSGVRG